MIKIHQIQLTDREIDLINLGGHDAVPANVARLDASVFGKFNPEHFHYYTEAYHVYVDDLEEAYRITNMWNEVDMPKVDVIGDRGVSTSMGDIFERDGEFFFCDAYGFSKIENLQLELV
ncbi:MAG: hypothetical protein ACO3MF_04560 [Acholeplasmataceae bacterium]